jgi:hypothetical protein
VTEPRISVYGAAQDCFLNLVISPTNHGFSPNQSCTIAFIKVVDVYPNLSTRGNAEGIDQRCHVDHVDFNKEPPSPGGDCRTACHPVGVLGRSRRMSSSNSDRLTRGFARPSRSNALDGARRNAGNRSEWSPKAREQQAANSAMPLDRVYKVGMKPARVAALTLAGWKRKARVDFTMRASGQRAIGFSKGEPQPTICILSIL